MKRFLLALMLLFATFTPSLSAEASGSNTVFMPVRATEFKLKPAYRDEAFNTSELFNYLESSQSNSIMVARVTPAVYRTAYYYTRWDYDVELAFTDYETIVFTYYPRLGAILGVSTDNDIVVLLPQE
ncbi:MAG: hypothetical protein V4655_04240 [Bdellovibrionota bacterium]